MSATELVARLNRGEVTSVEVTLQSLQAIAGQDANIRAFLSTNADAAIAQAKSIDEKRKAGQPVGKLAGLPIALKDNMCVTGVKTTCASRILENFVPPYDAGVVEKLKAADAVLIGKTNLDEFAMGSSTENSAFQVTRNPWNVEHTVGGSSGGSAAAVAARMVPWSLGSDTGGSIRQPAGFCGVVGMKPTYGRVSRYGLVAYASSLDQIGPFATDVASAALLLEIISGHDGRDSTSVDRPVPEYSQSVEQPLNGLRVGIAREHFVEGLDREVEAAIKQSLDVYRSLGAEVVELSLPHSKYAIATYYLIAASEASSNLARFDGVHYGHRAAKFDNLIDMYSASRGEGFGAEVKRRIMLGTYALSAGYYDAYYLKAQKVRTLIKREFESVLATHDVILTPTSPSVAFRLGEKVDDPYAMYLNDLYTIPVNIAGNPALSLPCGFSQGLPVGMQLIGRPFEESTLLGASHAYEQVTDWNRRMPPGSHNGLICRA